jgi:hypothetical protein
LAAPVAPHEAVIAAAGRQGGKSLVAAAALRMTIGASNMAERTADSEGDETQDNRPEPDESATGSAAEQAKKREREMEESGQENAT